MVNQTRPMRRYAGWDVAAALSVSGSLFRRGRQRVDGAHDYPDAMRPRHLWHALRPQALGVSWLDACTTVHSHTGTAEYFSASPLFDKKSKTTFYLIFALFLV